MANPKNPNRREQDPAQSTPRRGDMDTGRQQQRNPGQQSEPDIEGEVPGREVDPNPDMTERRPHREQR